MTERPILFSGTMVRAILDGRKTQTRRVVNPQLVDWAGREADGMKHMRRLMLARCQYENGYRLWVRERFRVYQDEGNWGDFLLQYHADNYTTSWIDGEMKGLPLANGRWRPSIHMPRWASRITLEVTGVRVERVQDISEADIYAEGVDVDGHHSKTPKLAWCDLWDSINEKRGYGWAANPWVWVVAFRMV